MTPFQLHLHDGAVVVGETIGQGKPVLAISGLGGAANFWKGVILDERQFQMIRFDQRGIGRSSRGFVNLSIEQLAQDCFDILDYLEIEQVHCIAHSTGGCIAQMMALMQPKRLLSLAIGGGWAGPNQYMRNLFTFRSDLLKQDENLYVKQGVYLSYPPQYIWQNPSLLSSDYLSWTQKTKDVVQERMAALLAFDARDRLFDLNVNTLIMSVDDDAVVPKYLQQELHQLILGSKIKRWKVGGHFFPISLAADYTKTVNEWLLLNSK